MLNLKNTALAFAVAAFATGGAQANFAEEFTVDEFDSIEVGSLDGFIDNVTDVTFGESVAYLNHGGIGAGHQGRSLRPRAGARRGMRGYRACMKLAMSLSDAQKVQLKAIKGNKIGKLGKLGKKRNPAARAARRAALLQVLGPNGTAAGFEQFANARLDKRVAKRKAKIAKKAKILFDVLNADQRLPAVKCMRAKKRMKKRMACRQLAKRGRGLHRGKLRGPGHGHGPHGGAKNNVVIHP